MITKQSRKMKTNNENVTSNTGIYVLFTYTYDIC